MANNGAEKREHRYPIFQGILPIDASQVPANIIAGITLAALAIPEVMGYTKISGTPVITGLYTILIPMTLYAFFGSSRHLVVGADSATAAILASSVAGMAAPRSEEWLALASLLALMAAGFLLIARIVRLGFLSDFLSRTVLVGFLSGVGIQVAAGEIAGMLGLTAGGRGTIHRLVSTFKEIGQTNATSLLIAVSVIAIIVGSRKISKKLPGALIAVVGAITMSWAFNLESSGVHVLGQVPHGLPTLGLPKVALDRNLFEKLVPTLLPCSLLFLPKALPPQERILPATTSLSTRMWIWLACAWPTSAPVFPVLSLLTAARPRPGWSKALAGIINSHSLPRALSYSWCSSFSPARWLTCLRRFSRL